MKLDAAARHTPLDWRSRNDETWHEIWRGLSLRPKRLPCKLFYDARGSELFERITRQPEYYLTRVELELLGEHSRAIAARTGAGAILVELGSGASRKTRVLLDMLDRPRIYVPIDISRSALFESTAAIRASYPGLEVRPLAADYTLPLALPVRDSERRAPVLAFFPGSTIGNFERTEALVFLRRLRQACGPRHQLLIGVDVPKERSVLEAAYDDAAGVTAEFNRNILRVINRRYAGRFDVEAFEHRALWNEKAGRLEMHLTSRRHQEVSIGGVSLSLRKGEPIVTEHCYKYHPRQFRRLAEAAGYASSEVWLDAEERFSLHLLETR
jgi:L-histidine N-alpha-methyltransferase